MDPPLQHSMIALPTASPTIAIIHRSRPKIAVFHPQDVAHSAQHGRPNLRVHLFSDRLEWGLYSLFTATWLRVLYRDGVGECSWTHLARPLAVPPSEL